MILANLGVNQPDQAIFFTGTDQLTPVDIL